MKSLAREMGRAGVTANAVSLGLVETGHDPEWLAANRESSSGSIRCGGSAVPRISRQQSRSASPRSGWITGQVISVSGGYAGVSGAMANLGNVDGQT